MLAGTFMCRGFGANMRNDKRMSMNNEQMSMITNHGSRINDEGIPKTLISDHCSLSIERPQTRRGEAASPAKQAPNSNSQLLTPNSSSVPCNLSPVTSSPQTGRQDACTTKNGSAALPKHSNSYLLTPNSLGKSRAAGFTLVEMLVALSILIILMAAVGEIFSLAGRTVRVGQATLAAMSSVRSMESQIAGDIHHLDTNGFLVIRQRYYAPLWQQSVQYEPGDEVEDTAGNYYLCQQSNITQAGITTGPSVPANAATGGTVDWQTLTGSAGQYPIWRADQICFMETGDFHSRSGSGSGAGATMAGSLFSNKAIAWFGQLSASYGVSGLNYAGGAAPAIAGGVGGVDQYEQPYWSQDSWVPLGTPPSGQTSGQFYFGREQTLLLPFGGGTAGSDVYTDPFYDPANFASGSPGVSYFAPTSSGATEAAATATSSRLDAAYDSIPVPADLLSATITAGGGTGTIEGYVNGLPLVSPYYSLDDIADFLCYRHSTLISPSAVKNAVPTPAPPLPPPPGSAAMLNGYYRMAPIMLQGVPSFSVDWTDGSTGTFTGTNNGQAVSATAPDWYGLDGNSSPTTPTKNANGPQFPLAMGTLPAPYIPNKIAVYGNSPASFLGPVTYVFYAGNKALWPRALKITYCVTDPNNRLQGGRFVTQVVELPQ